MLKFRLPWAAGTTKYLNGDIELPVWGPITTTEARLIPSHGTREWDNTVYEEQMFYFNTVTRVARYHHGCSVDPHVSGGLDYCFDCKAEVEVWQLNLLLAITFEHLSEGLCLRYT